MRILNRVKAAYQTFRTVDNAMGGNLEGSQLARQYRRHGSTDPMVQNWSQVLMSDADLYTGFSYAAINNRANGVAQLATENLKTRAKQTIMDAARKKDELVQHPYLKIIDESKTFANYKFWYDIPTYLDLEGIYFLMAIRTVEEGANGKVRVGNIQEFKLLNPYEVKRVRNMDTLEIGGYLESHDGLYREIVPEMIIEIQMLNPFSRDNPYGMTDAMKDSQFTLKTAGDYTRHSIANNINAPGIISSEILLEPERFQNFKSRIVNREKPGEPLFGNGSGAINWQDMQIDLNKAALDKIHELNLNSVSATSGVSKTMFGIEQSGVTRDTAKVQKDLFIANHVMPLLQRIIDALNQDYKRYYEPGYLENGYTFYIDSPLGVDREAELKDVEIRTKSQELYSILVSKGFDRDIAAKYANGEIGLDELGEPTNEPVTVIPPVSESKDTADKSSEDDETEENALKKVTNYNPNHDKDGRFGAGGAGRGFNPSGRSVSPESANKHITKNYSDTSFTPDEEASVHNYTGSQFAAVNKNLRTGWQYGEDGQISADLKEFLGETGGTPSRNARLKSDIKNLKSLTMKNSLKQDTVLFRFADMNRDFKVGDAFNDKGFASTSLSKSVAEEMLDRSTRSKNILKVNARKGTNGVFPRAVGVNNPEAEFILHDNTTYKVAKVSPKEDYTLVEVDLL